MGSDKIDYEVLCSEGPRNAFLLADPLKNVYGHFYHVREPETRSLFMGFWEFVQCAWRWTTRHVYFQVRG